LAQVCLHQQCAMQPRKAAYCALQFEQSLARYSIVTLSDYIGLHDKIARRRATA
jgi:hypothetical protein